MKNLDAWIPCLWAASVVVQAIICLILIVRGHFRTLPIFTAYLALNLCQAVFLYAVYGRYGKASHVAYVCAWRSEVVTLIAKAFATVEVLRLVLASYRGIWGLVWRLLTVTCVGALVAVGIAARGHGDWAMMEADRGYHLIFATAVIASLLLVRYYRIRVEPTYQVLLAGFCFYSGIKILVNTVLQQFLYKQYVQFDSIWQLATTLAYILVLGLWAVGLARPLPNVSQAGAIMEPSVYRTVGPRIHRQLQTINEQLIHFWKIEEPRS